MQTQAALTLQGQQRRNNLPLRVRKRLIARNNKANRSLGVLYQSKVGRVSVKEIRIFCHLTQRNS